MSVFWLTVYVLIWPLVVGGTLFVIVRAFYREWRQARAEGRGMV
ncbi:putative transporter small subunit [Paeniglutamicibacter sp. ZC-3]|nr:MULTISPECIES: putative transporter small subunit [Paeniglutamicibacter]MCV9995676.1 putative transporter small subunit [Paeniglutamicibacter sp. ZC-3]MDO2935722.1 putative transporter small subunit [Paeniglutamicibacter sulfureus]